MTTGDHTHNRPLVNWCAYWQLMAARATETGLPWWQVMAAKRTETRPWWAVMAARVREWFTRA